MNEQRPLTLWQKYKSALILGHSLLGLSLLFPPWCDLSERILWFVPPPEFVGFSFILWPPSSSAQIDFDVLAMEFVAIWIVSLVMTIFLHRRNGDLRSACGC